MSCRRLCHSDCEACRRRTNPQAVPFNFTIERGYARTKTEANLAAAFAGESQARNKYTYYASKAKKDGYEQIAALFLETANNEKEHAKIWFKLLHDGIGDTAANLEDAAAGRLRGGPYMYATFAKEARKRV